MPLFEYRCRQCGRQFETLVTGNRQPTCPACHGRELDKLVSIFGVGSSSRSSGRSPIVAGPT